MKILMKKCQYKDLAMIRLDLDSFLDTKKSIERKELNPHEVKKYLNMRKSDDISNVKENVSYSKKSKKSDQVGKNRETKESHVKGLTCDELEHCKGKSFKPISNFYCHYCHGYGHYVAYFKKPKFDNDSANSRIFRNTNHVGNRRRSHKNESGERRQIVCYKCNNLGHIARIVEHLTTIIMKKEGMYLYVSYVKSFTKWIEET